MNKNILVVEDEQNLGDTLSEYLQSKGYSCELATTAARAREIYSSPKGHPHIVIMDIGLPDGNGIDLAREFRNENKQVVLFFLSAQNDPDTRLKGLEVGAHDYITKPFNLKELLLRMQRVFDLMGRDPLQVSSYEWGKLKVWFERYQVQNAQGEILNLSQKECQILKLLFEKRERVLTRDQIIEKVWGEGIFPSNRTVDNYIVKLRKWMETDDQGIVEIVSVRGIGYKMLLKGD